MKKISKKIVALATMAAFVLTLLPVAAFGAEPTLVDWENSYILTQGQNVKVNPNNPVDLTLEMVKNDGSAVVSGDNQQIFLWVEDEEENITTDATFTYGDDSSIVPTVILDNGYAGRLGKGYNDRNDLKVSISKPGTYTIHAGVALDNTNKDPGSVSDIREFKTEAGQDTIVVRGGDEETVSLINNVEVDGTGIAPNAVEPGTDAGKIDMGDFLTNGRAKATVTGDVFVGEDKDTQAPRNTVLDLSANLNGLTLSDTQIETERDGSFEFTFTLDRAGLYQIYIESGDYTYTLTVDAQDAQKAEYITTSLNNGRVLEAENATVDFSDAVQFTITDKDGNELTGALGEAAETYGAADYVTVETPEDTDLDANNFKLYWDETAGVYTIDYQGDPGDLVAGEYTVGIALESGNSAEATFTLAEMGDPVGLEIELTGDKTGKLDDTIVKGEKVTAGTVYNVDENGIRDDVTTSAYTSVSGAAENVNYLTFTASDNEDDLGKTITVKAFNAKTGKSAEKVLTIVDGQSEYSLAFDGENGPANADNKVKVSVVDENGDVVTDLGATAVYANVLSKSNEDAKVQVNPTANSLSAGKGTLTIFSDKETDLEVLVTVIENPNSPTERKIYAGTLNYTVGANAPVEAEKTVVMTIGSSDIVVNNDFVTGDAAPYVDENWRTMVPYRVLGETFGATVTWNGEDQTITAVDGDTTLVMTIGETTYTINDTEYTMDTAPVIGENDRTYVPGRFFAEALGYEVTTLKDANGLTAGVVFQK